MKEVLISMDKSIDVKKIMSEIIAKANEINPNSLRDDYLLMKELEFTGITPNILSKIKQPISKKNNLLSKNILNKILVKLYYIIWNTMGDAVVTQQEYNNYLLQKIVLLEEKIQQLKKKKK